MTKVGRLRIADEHKQKSIEGFYGTLKKIENISIDINNKEKISYIIH